MTQLLRTAMELRVQDIEEDGGIFRVPWDNIYPQYEQLMVKSELFSVHNFAIRYNTTYSGGTLGTDFIYNFDNLLELMSEAGLISYVAFDYYYEIDVLTDATFPELPNVQPLSAWDYFKILDGSREIKTKIYKHEVPAANRIIDIRSAVSNDILQGNKGRLIAQTVLTDATSSSKLSELTPIFINFGSDRKFEFRIVSPTYGQYPLHKENISPEAFISLVLTVNTEREQQ